VKTRRAGACEWDSAQSKTAEPAGCVFASSRAANQPAQSLRGGGPAFAVSVPTERAWKCAGCASSV